MKHIIYSLTLTILLILGCICLNRCYSQRFITAYYNMPQIIFEDMCLDHPDWTQKEMGRYYYYNKERLDAQYKKSDPESFDYPVYHENN